VGRHLAVDAVVLSWRRPGGVEADSALEEATYVGGRIIAKYIVDAHAVARVFEDFRYEREIGGEGPGDHALLFRARVGDRELQGCDFLHTAEDGLIDEMTVMVRPRSAMLALAEAMQAEVLAAERAIGADAPA